MKLIESDKFLQDMADLYRQAGWDEREVHFSLADLRSNIGMEDVILIPRREADTVPVIRCKDCVHKNEYGYCTLYINFHHLTEDMDYCSDAEREEK